MFAAGTAYGTTIPNGLTGNALNKLFLEIFLTPVPLPSKSVTLVTKNSSSNCDTSTAVLFEIKAGSILV